MIQATIEPLDLFVDEPNELTVRLTNRGPGRCTNIILALELPSEIVRLRGPNRIELARLGVDECATHVIRVRPKAIGTWTLESSNFSYRDGLGRSIRIADLRMEVTVVPARPVERRPEPRLEVELFTKELPFKAWEVLAGQVRNTGEIPVWHVLVRVDGPFTRDVKNDPKQVLGEILPGRAVDFGIPVCVDQSGGNVPVHLDVSFTDGDGRTVRQARSGLVFVRPSTQTEGRTWRRSNMNSEAEVSILFLASEPTELSRIRVGQELREIQEKLSQARMRQRFTLETRAAVRAEDLSGAVLDLRPQIVHFAGHGTSTGEICLEDAVAGSRPVKPDKLAALFKIVARFLDCVVLNACFSEAQARAIVAHVDYVVGMRKEIGDKAAIAFTVGFYQALGADYTIEEAFDAGCAQIGLRDLSGDLTPILLRKKDLGPSQP